MCVWLCLCTVYMRLFEGWIFTVDTRQSECFLRLSPEVKIVRSKWRRKTIWPTIDLQVYSMKKLCFEALVIIFLKKCPKNGDICRWNWIAIQRSIYCLTFLCFIQFASVLVSKVMSWSIIESLEWQSVLKIPDVNWCIEVNIRLVVLLLPLWKERMPGVCNDRSCSADIASERNNDRS